MKGRRCAYRYSTSVLLEELLISSVCMWYNRDERNIQEVGEILILPKGEEFSV